MLHPRHVTNVITKVITKAIPTECYLCAIVDNHDTPNLCGSCEHQLPYMQSYCYQCALPLCKPDFPCGRCLKIRPSYDESYCAMEYRPPVSTLISIAKYNRQLTSLSTLGIVFASAYKKYRNNRHQIKPDLIVPIPLNWKRQLIRGFNQSQLLADIVSSKIGIPMDNQILKRVYHTKPQQGLSKAARLKNLENSFVSSQKAEGLNIALLDDVITTGATMEAAASTLKKAGATSVVAWSLARTL